jgi:hypothetical protein
MPKGQPGWGESSVVCSDEEARDWAVAGRGGGGDEAKVKREGIK